MSLFVLDTDILTLFQRKDPAVVAQVAAHAPAEIAIGVITVEEQLSGWYTQLRKAKDNDKLAWAYLRLAANVRFVARVQILDFDRPAIQRYEDLKRSGAAPSSRAAWAVSSSITIRMMCRGVRNWPLRPAAAIFDSRHSYSSPLCRAPPSGCR